MKQIRNCFVKEAGSSSNGINILCVLIKEKEYYLTLNTGKCKKIIGLNDFLSSYLSNTLRVYTPAKIDLWADVCEVELTLEKVKFVCNIENVVPSFMGTQIPALTEKTEVD